MTARLSAVTAARERVISVVSQRLTGCELSTEDLLNRLDRRDREWVEDLLDLAGIIAVAEIAPVRYGDDDLPGDPDEIARLIDELVDEALGRPNAPTPTIGFGYGR